MDRLRRDKTPLEIGMDNAGGGGRFVASINRPGAGFFFAGGQVGPQAKQMIDSANQCAHAAFLDPEIAQIFLGFGFAQVDQLAFNLGADDDCFSREMVPGIFLHCLDVGVRVLGTGRSGQSVVMAVDPKTGKPIVQHILPPEYFGEGIVDWGPYILEWTWKSEICFVYDRATLQLVTQFNYKGEGWGMTRTASELITSDGSATLTFRDPNTFQETHHIVVKDDGKPVDNLNELEFVKGEIYANV